MSRRCTTCGLEDPREEALYFVTTGLPGPGSSAIVREAVAQTDTYEALIERLRDLEFCDFVELENGDGRSVGREAAEWHAHPNAPGLWRLGPVPRDEGPPA